MDLQAKLAVLADAAKYDASCASSGARRERPAGGVGHASGSGICHSYTPDGRCVSLLKVLLTNRCVYDCAYCVNRVSSDVPRAAFTVDEVVRLTMGFYRRNVIEGLFLSSGIVGSPDHTMGLLVEVGRKLREDERYGGYLHLKAVPGASPELLAAAARHADRLSANVELPTQRDLDALAPAKTMAAVEATMTTLHDVEREAKAPARRARPPKAMPAGQSTQMVVGATPSSDAEVLGTARRLYETHGLRRVYYTAYSPTQQPHPGLPVRPIPLVREHRLYQADWLLRFYGFGLGELLPAGGDLPLDVDPKTAWALAHRGDFPVDLDRAPREVLLRVPGLGVRTVERLLRLRRRRGVRLEDLRHLRVPLGRALPWLALAGDRTAARALDAAAPPVQLGLFDR
ncbi:MAG: putative DNA modification/repair radical SAM protein [Myxococcota bacterium]